MASEQEYTTDSPQTSTGKFIRQENKGDFKNNRKQPVVVLNICSGRKKQFFYEWSIRDVAGFTYTLSNVCLISVFM